MLQNHLEKILDKLPFVNTIYNTIKQIWSISTCLRMGAAKLSRKINKNFKIQNVTAMGTIAIRPAKIRLLID